MKLYLVKGRVVRASYMNNTDKAEWQSRVVWADSWEEACEKFTKHFEDNSDPYSVSYRVNSVEAHEEIS